MKLLASDFDGTLFFTNEEPNIRIKDIETIREFQKNGNLFGICSGRMLSGITRPCKDKIDFDFYILNNGSYILDKDFNKIHYEPLNTEEVIKICDELKHENTMIVTDGYVYLYHNTRGWNAPDMIHVQDFNEVAGKEVMSFSFHCESDEEAKEVVDFINDKGLDIIAYQNRNDIDCIRKGNSKGRGMAIIQEFFKLEKSDVACIGDSFNDLPMLSSVEQSFTFNTSPESLQKQVKYTVDSVAEAIHKLY